MTQKDIIVDSKSWLIVEQSRSVNKEIARLVCAHNVGQRRIVAMRLSGGHFNAELIRFSSKKKRWHQPIIVDDKDDLPGEYGCSDCEPDKICNDCRDS